ncbi:hypothetical protein [Celeribacter neptunius]|uniref:Uncharacterized protein n=1 Tax=Celeribacter neptunius TaxID=588602 RepID=A0A1I3P5D4_9RHOB|nr:hypothetical protein [Celeribacter neptunius]SFJ16570.1 hypothetical protein SAMN04487991_1565 [Celeribacter neptunius]
MTDATFASTAAVESHDHHEDGIATPRGVALFLLFVVAALSAVAYGVFTIGPWVLGLTALAFVPVIYLTLILLTTGR